MALLHEIIESNFRTKSVDEQFEFLREKCLWMTDGGEFIGVDEKYKSVKDIKDVDRF